jgi:hypothetical protein
MRRKPRTANQIRVGSALIVAGGVCALSLVGYGDWHCDGGLGILLLAATPMLIGLGVIFLVA